MPQGVFFNAYFLAYLLSPKTCHAFVGYLEEEAVKTYTHALKVGYLSEWATCWAALQKIRGLLRVDVVEWERCTCTGL